MFRKLEHDESGFNLLELMIVVLILGIVTTIALATYAFSVQNARTISCLANQRVLDDAASVVQAKDGAPITDIEELRSFANQFDTITHCPSDFDTILTWNTATEEIECAIHPR